ncbi:unnamed protein product [Eretmochelys imbricata]
MLQHLGITTCKEAEPHRSRARTCPARGAVNEELSTYNPLMGGTLPADKSIQFLLAPADSLTRILLINPLGIHGLTLPLQLLHPECIKAYSGDGSLDDSLFCSFPLGHLALATVGRQDTGLDGPLV